MKKLFSIMLAFIMVLGLCSCTVKLSTTTAIPGTEVPEGPEPVEEPVIRTYEDYTLEEKMEYKSVLELIAADVEDTGLLAPAKDIGTELWGYINIRGEWVINPMFKFASGFSEDYAGVIDLYGDYVYIDRTGKKVITSYSKKILKAGTAFSEGIVSVMVDVNGAQNYTYLGTNGKAVFDISKLPLTKGISYDSRQYLQIATPFRNGKAVIMRITNAALDAKENTKYRETAYIIDPSRSILAAIPQGLDVSPAGFDENMRIVVTNGSGLYGLVDEFGSMVIPCNYLRLLHCEGDLYLACNQSGFWGYLNKNGARVIDFKYSSAMPFSEGLAAVYDGSAWGFINVFGQTVIDFQFDSVKALKTSVCGSEENNGAFSCGVAVVQKGRFWGIINEKGDILIAAESESCPVTAVHEGFMTLEYMGTCSVFTTDGKYVILSRFLSVGEFR